jgi:hypothetical protein
MQNTVVNDHFHHPLCISTLVLHNELKKAFQSNVMSIMWEGTLLFHRQTHKIASVIHEKARIREAHPMGM